MCVIDFDEYCTIWNETERTARKQHKCSSCGGRIQPGEKYVDHFDVFEGEANHEKCCMACDVDRKEFGKAHEVSLGPGGWREYLDECIAEDSEYDSDTDEYRPGEDAKRWIAMRERLKERRQRAKESQAC